MAFKASSSSFWRRPVMKTWAPSFTKSFAVANPIPSVPPVMTAVLPSSFLVIAFLRCCRAGTPSPDTLLPSPVNYSPSLVLWEGLSEHGSATLRLLFGGLVLNHVPVLDKDSVLDAHNIRGNPIHRSTETTKSPVHDHEVSLSHDRSRFVFQCWGDALNEIEQTFATGFDMSAVLNV